MISMPYGVQVSLYIVLYITEKRDFLCMFTGTYFFLFSELAFSNALDAQHTKVDNLATASIIKEEDARLTSRNESVEGNVCILIYDIQIILRLTPIFFHLKRFSIQYWF